MLNKQQREMVKKTKLGAGKHSSIEDGACVMEMVSYLANEPWSDHPKCACPALTSFAIRINDSSDDTTRAKLKKLAPKLVRTRDDKRKERALFLAHQSITVFLPILTEALELTEITVTLRGFKQGQWTEAKTYIQSVRPTIREAAKKHPAYDAAAAAAAAAYDAAAAAYAAAAAAAYAAADAAAAAAAADAAAYAAADAAAAAAAAAAYDAAPSKKAVKFWQGVKKLVWLAAVKALEQAIEIK